MLESLFALIACATVQKERLLPCGLVGADPSGFVPFSSAKTLRSVMTKFQDGNL